MAPVFKILARLAFDGTTFQAGMARAERQVKGFAGGVASGVGRAIAPWFGFGMFSRLTGMLKQFAENGDQIKRKWSEMGIVFDDQVVGGLIKAGRAIESLKAAILMGLAPAIQSMAKSVMTFVGLLAGKAGFWGGATQDINAKDWVGAFIYGDRKTFVDKFVRNALKYGVPQMNNIEGEWGKLIDDIFGPGGDFFADKEKKAVKQKDRNLLTGGMAKSTDDLAKIGGFSMIGGYNDQIRLSRQQLDQLVKIAMNTSDLKGIPS